MLTTTSGDCQHCGFGHVGTCPRIKAIEYHPDGAVKRIEFHPMHPMHPVVSAEPLHIIRVPDAPCFTTGK